MTEPLSPNARSQPRAPRLAGFRNEFVFDWLDFCVMLRRTTTIEAIRNRAGLNPSQSQRYVRAVAPGPSGASNQFVIRFDSPAHWSDVAAGLREVGGWAEFASPPELRAAEIAWDFYSLDNDVTALDAMTHRLMTGLDGPTAARQYTTKGHKVARMENDVGGDRIATFKTMRIGSDQDPVALRVYLKHVDTRGKALPPDRWRARAEVTLKDEEARKHVKVAEDLSGIALERASRHFRFRRLADDFGTAAGLNPLQVLHTTYKVNTRGINAIHPEPGSRRRHSALTTPNSLMTRLANDGVTQLARRFNRKISRTGSARKPASLLGRGLQA